MRNIPSAAREPYSTQTVEMGGFPRYARDVKRQSYRFFFAQPLTRSSAFSMFAIELATLKRR
jgi:hypothetical protein